MLTTRFGIGPEVIDHMPIDLVYAYIGSLVPETMTFSDDAALQRYYLSQGFTPPK